MSESTERFTVGRREEGQRLDMFLAKRLVAVSRSQIEKLARSGQVVVNGRPARPGEQVRAGEVVEIHVPAPAPGQPSPLAIPLEIAFEDDQLLVVNKPPGLSTHPATDARETSLVSALLAHWPSLPVGRGPARPGIVHRLDRYTSGLLLVAKTEEALAELSRQVREREVERRYWALVWGVVKEDGMVIDVPVRRLMSDPTRVVTAGGSALQRPGLSATTEVRTLQRYQAMTLMEAKLLTGRTHQIRVHLNHVGHPVVGDRVYGVRRGRKEKRALDYRTRELVSALPGQALHAQGLRFRHPASGQEVTIAAPPPEAMGKLLAHLDRGVV